MDRAYVALSEGLEPNEPRTYAALSNRHGVAKTTLWNRAHGQLPKEEKAKRQQHLNPSEEKALVKYLLRMSNNGYPIPIEYLRSLAVVIAHQRSFPHASSTDGAIKPRGKNWPQGFYNRHPKLKAKRVRALDWHRHDKNIYPKISH